MAKSMEETQSPLCKNCAQPLQGKYCSACGQSARVDRIDWGNLAQELSESVFQINRGLLFTLLELFRRPGESIQEFLDGKRKNHLKPIAYVLTLSTIYFLVTKLTGQKTYLDDFVDGYQNSLMQGGSGTGLLELIIWLSKNYAYAALLMLPIFSLASFLSFFGSGKNYLEHVVLNSYMTGQQAVINSFFALLAYFSESILLELLPLALAITYTGIVYWQFFREGSRLGNLLRTALTYLINLLISMLFLIALAYVVTD